MCRSELNILLCGDPGTSKSQLLQYVFNLVPRGQYTSGKGSSAVGLTAYITKDPETRQLVLQTYDLLSQIIIIYFMSTSCKHDLMTLFGWPLHLELQDNFCMLLIFAILRSIKFVKFNIN